MTPDATDPREAERASAISRRQLMDSTAGTPAAGNAVGTRQNPVLVLETPVRIPADDRAWALVRSKVPPAKAQRMGKAFIVRDGTQEVRGAPGDWVVVGPDGDAYILKDAQFRSTYEPATGGPQPPAPSDVAMLPATRAETTVAVAKAVEALREVATLMLRVPEAPPPKQYIVCPICGSSTPAMPGHEDRQVEEHIRKFHPFPKPPKGAV